MAGDGGWRCGATETHPRATCLGRDCDKLTDAAIVAVAESCPNLKHLDVE